MIGRAENVEVGVLTKNLHREASNSPFGALTRVDTFATESVSQLLRIAQLELGIYEGSSSSSAWQVARRLFLDKKTLVE